MTPSMVVDVTAPDPAVIAAVGGAGDSLAAETDSSSARVAPTSAKAASAPGPVHSAQAVKDRTAAETALAAAAVRFALAAQVDFLSRCRRRPASRRPQRTRLDASDGVLFPADGRLLIGEPVPSVLPARNAESLVL